MQHAPEGLSDSNMVASPTCPCHLLPTLIPSGNSWCEATLSNALEWARDDMKQSMGETDLWSKLIVGANLEDSSLCGPTSVRRDENISLTWGAVRVRRARPDHMSSGNEGLQQNALFLFQGLQQREDSLKDASLF